MQKGLDIICFLTKELMPLNQTLNKIQQNNSFENDMLDIYAYIVSICLYIFQILTNFYIILFAYIFKSFLSRNW